MTENALFRRQGDVYLPGENAGGPWSPDFLHGGAPAGRRGPSRGPFLVRSPTARGRRIRAGRRGGTGRGRATGVTTGGARAQA